MKKEKIFFVKLNSGETLIAELDFQDNPDKPIIVRYPHYFHPNHETNEYTFLPWMYGTEVICGEDIVVNTHAIVSVCTPFDDVADAFLQFCDNVKASVEQLKTGIVRPTVEETKLITKK